MDALGKLKRLLEAAFFGVQPATSSVACWSSSAGGRWQTKSQIRDSRDPDKTQATGQALRDLCRRRSARKVSKSRFREGPRLPPACAGEIARSPDRRLPAPRRKSIAG